MKFTNIPKSFIDYEGNEIEIDPNNWNWLEEHNSCDRFSISPEDSVWIKIDDMGIYQEVDPYEDEYLYDEDYYDDGLDED